MHKTKEKREPDLRALDTYLFKILSWKPRIGFGSLSDTRVRMKCELIAPKKQEGKGARVEMLFIGNEMPSETAGLSEYSGTNVTLVAPSSSAASVLEVLCAGRFRFVKVDYRPVLRHRLEDVTGFQLIGELEDDLD